MLEWRGGRDGGRDEMDEVEEEGRAWMEGEGDGGDGCRMGRLDKGEAVLTRTW